MAFLEIISIFLLALVFDRSGLEYLLGYNKYTLYIYVTTSAVVPLLVYVIIIIAHS